MAKALDGPYVEDKRVQLKVKHHRSADCVVGGYREHKDGGVGSLLLGLFDDGDPADGRGAALAPRRRGERVLGRPAPHAHR